MVKTALIPFNKPAFGKPFGKAFGKGVGGEEDFQPSDIDNLVLWLDASFGLTPSSGDITTWADRSKEGNDVVQGSTIKRPALNPTGINGHPSLTFVPNANPLLAHDMSITDAAQTGLNFTGSFTAYVVNQCTSFAGFPTMFGKSANDFRFLYSSNGAGRAILGVGAGKDITSITTTTVNQPSIMELQWEIKVGGVVTFSLNGVELGASQFSTVAAITRGADPFFVGQGGGDIQFFTGEIGQVLIYDRLLTQTERNRVGAFLGNRYNIPWTDITHTPLDVPNLVLWLDAARGVSPNNEDDPVSAWVDQSGNGNDAAQPTAGKRPAFKATAFNGFPTLEFSSATDENMEIDDAASIDLGSDFTFYMALKSVALTSDRYIFSKGGDDGYEIFFDDSNGERIVVGVKDNISLELTTADTAPTDSTDIILEVHYQVNGLVSFTQNGVPLGELKSNNRTSVNQNASKLFISSKDGTASPFEGEISQVLLYRRLLNLNERNFVGNYLAGRYGFTWTDIKPFAPTDFDGLVLWLDADEEITHPGLTVTAWADQGPQSNDVAQDDSFKQPFFTRQGLAGKDAAAFTRVIQGRTLVAPADSSLNFTGSFSFFAVMDFLLPDSTILSKNGDSGYRVLIGNKNNLETITSSNSEGPITFTGGRLPAATPLILDVNYEVGGANRVRFSNKGASLGNFLNTLADINSTSADLILGGLTNSVFLEGKISQILLYDNLLSIPERNVIGNYLADRYGQQWQDITNEFVPTDLTGLALWLDASVGATPFGGPIGRWEDQSGNGFVAVQNDPAKTIGFDPNALGAQGALVWQPMQFQFLEMPVAQSSILDLTTDFTFYTVARLQGGANNFTLLSRNITNGYEFRASTLSRLETVVNDGGGAETDTSPNAIGGFQILEIHYQVGGTINFTANGVALGAAQVNTLGGIFSNAANLFIGARGPGINPWHGEISQFIIYNRLLTTEERNQVGTYLSTRYAIPWAGILFKPDDINDLTFWLDAAVGIVLVGNKVSTWTDQTSTPLVASQGTDANRAVFEATGLNGHPTLDFDGVNDEYTIPDNADLDISSSFTMYIVCQPELFDLRTMFSKNQTNSYVWSVDTGGKQRFQSSGTPAGIHDVSSIGPATIAASESVILEIHYLLSGASEVNFTKNGLSMGTVSSPANSIFASSIQAFLGSGAGINFFSGKISQVLLYKRLLTTEERNQVGTYLGARYGIPWTIIT